MSAAQMPGFPVRPSDISVWVSLREVVDRYHELGLRLLEHRHGIALLSAEQAAAYALGELATGAAIADRVRSGRWVAARDALIAGATLAQVDDAVGLGRGYVGPGLREWADDQHRHGLMSHADHERVLELLCRPRPGEVDR